MFYAVNLIFLILKRDKCLVHLQCTSTVDTTNVQIIKLFFFSSGVVLFLDFRYNILRLFPVSLFIFSLRIETFILSHKSKKIHPNKSSV